MFQIQEDEYFPADLKRLVHKILIFKSNFKLVGIKFVSCFIALFFVISRNLVETEPFKAYCKFVFFQIRINFLKKSSNFD